ncbi:MAG: PEP-CTERM sorting domain-containing protein [Gammaproteobacteria bacterium]
MHKLLTVALASALVLCAPSFAAQRTFAFSATVATVGTGPEGETQSSVEGWIDGTRVYQGDLVTGTLQFDDALAPWAVAGDTAEFSGSAYSQLDLLLPARALALQDKMAYMQGYRTYQEDGFFLDGYEDYRKVTYSFSVHMPVNTAVPYAIGLDPAGANRASLVWHPHGEPGYSYMTLNWTSLAEVAPVPEPSTVGMLLAGMALVGAAARRRGASRAPA